MDLKDFAKIGGIDGLLKGDVPLRVEHNGQVYTTQPNNNQRQDYQQQNGQQQHYNYNQQYYNQQHNYNHQPSYPQQQSYQQQPSYQQHQQTYDNSNYNNKQPTKNDNDSSGQSIDLTKIFQQLASSIKIEGTHNPASDNPNSNFIDLSHLLKNGLPNIQLEGQNGGSIDLSQLFGKIQIQPLSNNEDEEKEQKVEQPPPPPPPPSPSQPPPYPYHAYYSGPAERVEEKVINVNVPAELIKGDLLDELGNIKKLSFGSMAKGLVRRAVKSAVYRIFPSVKSLKGVAERGCKDVQSIGSLDSVLMPLGLAVTLHPLLMPLVPFLLLTLGTIKAIESATCFVSDFF